MIIVFSIVPIPGFCFKGIHKKRTLILIGPEGDFSPTEIEMALQNQYKAVSLGKTRLRTETAGLVAVHTVNIKN